MRLEEIKNTIEALPGKRARSGLVKELQKYCEQVARAHELLCATVSRRSLAEEVFSEGDFGRIDELVKKVASTARRAHKALIEDISKVREKSIENAIINITEGSDNARRALIDIWRNLMNRKLEDFAVLVKAASEAKLEGSGTLASTHARLGPLADSPPDNGRNAAEIKLAFEQLGNSIQHLGLEGSPGEFLSSAAQGTASARDLDNPAIRRFLDQHNLWRLLRVRLG
jgi:hypothetical protein